MYDYLIYIPIYGIEAAAIITFISLLLFTFVSFVITQHHFNLKLPYLKYVKIVIPNLFLLFLCFYLVTDSLIQNIFSTTIIIIIAILIPVLFKILQWKNVKELLSFK